jgi:hypothetical protein
VKKEKIDLEEAPHFGKTLFIITQLIIEMIDIENQTVGKVKVIEIEDMIKNTGK